MIRRVLEPRLAAAAARFPVVTVTGPRQSGKTTLCRAAFGSKPYASLEDPDTRRFAMEDPRAFLAQYPDGAVIDEIQRAPDLASYLQRIVDDRRAPGLFILTGSQHFGVMNTVSQSLAGRSAMLTLLPLSHDEVRRFDNPPRNLFEALVTGGYPAILDRRLPVGDWLSAYTRTYVERDVRQLTNVTDLMAFQTFVRLCAGRTAQLNNLSALAADTGITHNTAKAWLSVLEASYLVHRLPPLHRNLGKRLVKTPKLHFYDSGLACYLLGIRSSDELVHHPLRGALFESWVVSEVVKAHVHSGVEPRLAFYRDSKRREVDLIVKRGRTLLALEIKSGQTIAPDFFTTLHAFAKLLEAAGTDVSLVLAYGGDTEQRRSNTRVLPWSRVAEHPWFAAPS
ncbi:MAG: ATP-binding protein [Proteobacteria bacterium]|nr:ATP-binding protein [Pseudomonadota bacterium]